MWELSTQGCSCGCKVVTLLYNADKPISERVVIAVKHCWEWREVVCQFRKWKKMIREVNNGLE